MKKIFVFIVLVFTCFLIVGCNDNNLFALKTINDTIDKIEKVTTNVYQISTSEFVNGVANQATEKGTKSKHEIVSYTPSDNFEEEGTGYNGSTFTSLNISQFNQPNKYIQIQQEIAYLNDNTQSLLKYITLKSNNIRVICTQLENSKSTINSETTEKTKDLCSKLLLNTNRLEITKNDVKNSYQKIKNNVNLYEDSESYNEYTLLSSCIQTRNSYLNNICYDIDGLENVIEKLLNNNEETKKTWSNIDTYKSNNMKNKTTNTNNTKAINNNNDNNYKNPYTYSNTDPYRNYNHGGYGTTNPYYGYGGFRGFGGIGFGMFPYSPYTNYNPYMPNVDTFGSYKNIDTYKPLNENDEENDFDLNENDNSNCFCCPYCHRKIYPSCCDKHIDEQQHAEIETSNNLDEKIDSITKKIQVVKPNKPPKIEKL